MTSSNSPAGSRASYAPWNSTTHACEKTSSLAVASSAWSRPRARDWLQAHPRWSFAFTPTHASWLNQIEIFFSILWRRLLKHGIFTSEDDLAQQMLAYIETYNQTATPFSWTYTGKVLEA